MSTLGRFWGGSRPERQASVAEKFCRGGVRMVHISGGGVDGWEAGSVFRRGSVSSLPVDVVKCISAF